SRVIDDDVIIARLVGKLDKERVFSARCACDRRVAQEPLIRQRRAAGCENGEGNGFSNADGLVLRLPRYRRRSIREEDADIIQQQGSVAALGVAFDKRKLHGGGRGGERIRRRQSIWIRAPDRRNRVRGKHCLPAYSHFNERRGTAAAVARVFEVADLVSRANGKSAYHLP